MCYSCQEEFKKVFIFFILTGRSPGYSIKVFYKAGFRVGLILRVLIWLFSGEFYFSERIFHVMMSSGSETILFSSSGGRPESY